MDLWIRSQEKDGLYKVDEVYTDKADYGNNDIIYYIKTEGVLLGTYKTKERALQVLDEIQNILKPIIYNEPITREITSPTDHYKKYECVEYLQTIQEMSTYVYEMPEK